MSLVWIEVFIVVAYAAELVKFFVIELPHIQDLRIRWLAGVLALGTGIVALLVLRPWDQRHGKHGKAAGHEKAAA
jgi:hypothetical protein